MGGIDTIPKVSVRLIVVCMALLVVPGALLPLVPVAQAATNVIQNPGFESSTAWTARYSYFFGSYAKVQDSTYKRSGSYSGLTQTTSPKQEICVATLYQDLNVPVETLGTFYYWIRKGFSAANGYYYGEVSIYMSGGYTLSYYHGFDGSTPQPDYPTYKLINVGNPATNSWVQISRNLYNDLVGKFGTTILTRSIRRIELNSHGYKNLQTYKRYGQRVNWDCLYMQGSFYCDISLTSSTTDGQTDVGTITFAATTYDLPTTIEKLQGSYSATANPPSGYCFDHWETSGDISVSCNTSQTTIVTVSNDGTLEATFVPARIITLTSSTNDGKSNVGTITFESIEYALPNSIQKPVGYYSVSGNPPSHYQFDHWETSGGISVSDATSQTTTATVDDSGTLKAIFKTRLWTFMVYMAGEQFGSSMDPSGVMSINKMETIGSTNEVAILVQFDRDDTGMMQPREGDPVPHIYNETRYLITKDNDTTSITSQVCWSVSEVNMGDPNSLVAFVEWGMQNYAAQNYALVLFNHGGGFQYICVDDIPLAEATFPWESDELVMSELKWALEKIRSDTGVTIDLIGFDACLMGQMEVAYQIRDLAQVYVGSEELSTTAMWPYDHILGNLTANPNMNPEVLATRIVTSYGHFYTYEELGPSYDWLVPFLTLSALDLSKIQSLAQSTSDLGSWLSDHMSTDKDDINWTRQNVYEFAKNMSAPHGGKYSYVDIYHLVELLNERIDDTQLQSLCQAVMQNVNLTVFSEWHATNVSDAHGVSIYFPDREEYYWSDGYDPLDMSDDCHWDDFLKDYLELEP